MDDETLQNLVNGQLASASNGSAPGSDTSAQQSSQTPKNYSFQTPTEAGYRETDPAKISGAPRPQAGMTFTPTGGSVSDINHQLRQQIDSEQNNPPPQNPEQPQA